MPSARKYFDNLIGGLAMNLAGPYLLRLGFHIFVVIVGVLILSGAVNTSIIGANGVLNRVAEDGVLLDWFRKPHRKFGTTYRIINLIALLQIATIIVSRGDVYLLGEAYAFGVVWSFFLKSLGVLVLRYPAPRSGVQDSRSTSASAGVEIPIGLGVTTLVLGFVAIANLFSKQIATIYGVAFTIVFFVVFTHLRAHQRSGASSAETQGAGGIQPGSSAAESTRRRCTRGPGCVLVAVRDYRRMEHLKTRARKDQPAPPRHRGDDGAPAFDRRRRIRSVRRADLQRLRTGTVQPRGGGGGKGRQAGGAAGGAGGRIRSTPWCRPPRSCRRRGW